MELEKPLVSDLSEYGEKHPMFVRHLGINETKILVYAGNFQREMNREPTRNQEISDLKIFICLRLCFQKQQLQKLSNHHFNFYLLAILKNCKETFPQKIQNEFPNGHRDG